MKFFAVALSSGTSIQRHSTAAVSTFGIQNSGIKGLRGRLVLVIAQLCAMAFLTGCVLVPGGNPQRSDVLKASANGGETGFPSQAIVFDSVVLDSQIVSVPSTYASSTLSKTFGLYSGAVSARLGVGDELMVTIFEAGPDGLFSTSEKKSQTVKLTIQPDGRAAVPYVGSIRLKGLSLSQARNRMLSVLRGRAVEPDVILNVVTNESRSVIVSGEVGASGKVPLGLRRETVLDVIARSGGVTGASSTARVTLTRNGTSRSVYFQTLLHSPSENIAVKPGDSIFVSQAKRSVTALGATGVVRVIPLEKPNVSLVETIALAGAGNPTTSDTRGFFVFRYEYKKVVELVLGKARVRELRQQGMQPDAQGRYPIAYRIDMTQPQTYFLAQNFIMRDGDVLFASQHPVADFYKFSSLLSAGVGTATRTTAVVNGL